MKKLLLAGAIVVGVLVIAAVVLPLLINADSFRPEIQSRLNATLGRQVTLGHLELSIFSGDLKADDIAISDDPAFSSTPFVQAKSLEVGVALLPLILSHALRAGAITLQEPQVVLLRSDSGKWNFSSLGQQGPGQAKATMAAMAFTGSPALDFTIAQLRVSDGHVTVGTAGGAAARSTKTYDNVNLSAQSVSFTSAFPFTLDAAAPGGGTLHLEGTVGPIDAQDAAQTPLEASAKIQQVNLASTGFADPASGVAGMVDYDGAVRSDGKLLHADGTATLSHLQLVKNGSPAAQPVSIKYSSDYDLAKQTGQLTNGLLTTGKSTVSLSGAYETHDQVTAIHMKLDAPSVPVEDIQALLPAVGVVLPAGSSLKGGTAETHLVLDGPVDQLVITGDIKLSNATVSGFGLGSKLSVLSAFTGAKGGGNGTNGTNNTLIQVMSSNVRMAPEGIRLDTINVVVPDIGTLTGAGTIGTDNALNFQMAVSIATGGTAGGLASRVGLGGATGKGIPFLIGGTASNPQFRPDTKAMVRSLTGNQPATIGNIVNGLLGGKKK